MKLTSRISGLDGLRKALARIADEAKLREQIRGAAEDIREAARATLSDGQSPVSRSSALANSLIIEMTDNGASARIGTDLDYGWHLEFGTRSRPATPWLEPALDAARPGVVRRISSWLASAAKR